PRCTSTPTPITPANPTPSATPVSTPVATETSTPSLSSNSTATTKTYTLSLHDALPISNTTAIAIPDSGAAAPYPSTINVTGMNGTLRNTSLKSKNLSNGYAGDVAMMIVGPGGQALRLMENAGTGQTTNSNLTFADYAAV